MVRTPAGNSEEFEVRVGVHQGSARSPLLFITVMNVLTEHLSDEEPWAMLFADGLVLAAETKEELQEKLENRRAALAEPKQRLLE